MAEGRSPVVSVSRNAAVTKATMKAIHAIRKRLPHAPSASATRGGSPLRDHPPSDDPADPASQRWYWRRARRHAEILHVHELAEQSLSQRSIARRTGHHCDTVKRWLKEPVPPLPDDMPADLPEIASLPAPLQRRHRKQQLKHLVHALRQEGLSYSAIARRVGIHRITVKRWLQQDPPPVEAERVVSREMPRMPPPPSPWSSWTEEA